MMHLLMLILAIIVIILIIIQENRMLIFNFFNRPPPQIKHQQKMPTKSLTLRPTINTRQYAYSHLSAFKDQTHGSCLSGIFFLAIQNQPSTAHKRTSWLHAKKWWEELYGTIQEHEETLEVKTHHNLTEWYEEHIKTARKGPLDDRAMQIITQSYNRIINHMDVEVLRLEQNMIKRHLCSLHPDKKGTSSAAILLIEWKALLTDQVAEIEHRNKLPFAGLSNQYQNKAKPWIVYELFLQHAFAIREQRHKDNVQVSISHIGEIREKIMKNDEHILKNEAVIVQLKKERIKQNL
ncbi:MAG: hypothetical protein CMF43_01335 [Legionellales bacterium]|nr:hypothetical protein [Legionellales bacterium]